MTQFSSLKVARQFANLLKKVFQFFCILDYEISYLVFSLPEYVITLVFTHKLTGHILSVLGGGERVAALSGAEIVGRILSVTKYACMCTYGGPLLKFRL